MLWRSSVQTCTLHLLAGDSGSDEEGDSYDSAHTASRDGRSGRSGVSGLLPRHTRVADTVGAWRIRAVKGTTAY